MPLFESSAEAWHDAFSTVEGFQDPYTPKPPKGTAPGDFREIRLAELSKIRRTIMALPDDLRHAGMWAYGPESEMVFQSRGKLTQKAWGQLLDQGPEKAHRSFDKAVRMTIMVGAVIEEARAQANGEKRLSEAEVASRMGIDRSSFSRTWAPVYRSLVEHLSRKARTALTEIEPLVHEINRRYRRAS